MKKKYEAFSLNGTDERAVKTFKNEPEALAFAKAHDDMMITKRDDQGRSFIWNNRHERWENK